MKGKTKGERKNKSIKKNQIPAFILTGGENEYKDFNTSAEAMNYAVEQVANKMEICTDKNVILKKIAEKEKLNKDNLIKKLEDLQSNMSNLEMSANKVTELQTEMDTCDKEKNQLQKQIGELTKKNEQLATQNNDITRISEELKTAQEQAEKDAIAAKEQAEKDLADNKDKSIAAIASELAAKIYGLKMAVPKRKTSVSKKRM